VNEVSPTPTMQDFSWHGQGWASAYENKNTMSVRFIFFRKSMAPVAFYCVILKKISLIFLFFKQIKFFLMYFR
jgi:hypothetical protein